MKKCWDLHIRQLSVPRSTHVGSEPSSSGRFSLTSCLFTLCTSGGLELCLQCDLLSLLLLLDLSCVYSVIVSFVKSHVTWLTSVRQHLPYSSCMLRVYNCIILIVHDVICAATSTATNKFSLPTCWRSSSSVWRQWRAPGSSTQRSVTLSFTFKAFGIKNKAYVVKRLQIGQVKDVGLTTFSIMSHNINTSRKGQSHVTLMHAN